MKTAMVIVRVKPHLKRRLSLIAEDNEMTLAEVYRAALEEFCSARGMNFVPALPRPVDYGEILPELAGGGE